MPHSSTHWSHRARFEATALGPSAARSFVCDHLVDHRLLALLGPMRFVVGEMALSAVVNGRTPFLVTLERTGRVVVVAVCGESMLRPWSFGGGHGLGIVEWLSLDWGVGAEEGSTTLWASFAVRSEDDAVTGSDPARPRA